MISQDAIQTILAIREKVYISPNDMPSKLNVTFYPHMIDRRDLLLDFSDKLQKSLIRLGVNIIPFEESWRKVPFLKRIRRFNKYLFNNIVWFLRKIFNLKEVNLYIPFNSILVLCSYKVFKKGISIICIGEQKVNLMPMQYISSFKDNSIITIVDFPKSISESSSFSEHFNTSMSLFAHHMTNIILAVDGQKMMIYNFNASHPIYPLNDGKFDYYLLNALIPKLVAPISPHKLSEFVLLGSTFDIKDPTYSSIIKDMREGARLFSKTNLFPDGKKIDDLKFRHNFHKLIGKLHLDHRNGMSFGFVAFQMPVMLSKVYRLDDFVKMRGDMFAGKDFFVDSESGDIFISMYINKHQLVLKVPNVWVLTLRSGSNKTDFDQNTDLLKIGLIKGQMVAELPEGLKVGNDYRPSFDTKVILAHAVGNAILASIFNYFDSTNSFANILSSKGYSISHWHGYFNKELVPYGLKVYGSSNPHVSCSSPQSAIYALHGKLDSFLKSFNSLESLQNYMGDIHVEPHHGININYPSLSKLASYIIDNPNSTELGNKYL